MKEMPKNRYNMIVAADLNWAIGKNGNLLTHLPEDMEFFKSVTTNKVVIMGKNTQVSLPNKLYLKNRFNIVLNDTTKAPYVLSTEGDSNTLLCDLPSIESIEGYINLFNLLQGEPERFPTYSTITNTDIFIIGGGQIYKQFLERDMINAIYLTRIYNEYDGDTFIPNLYELGFKETLTVMPKTTNSKGITYSISILTK